MRFGDASGVLVVGEGDLTESLTCKKYIALYIAEFQFCYDKWFNDDIFSAAIEGC